jgi:hypothetical protein
MYTKFIPLLIFTFLAIYAKAQSTTELKKMDATHSFKDLKFESSDSTIKDKLQLKDAVWSDTYLINNSKYLSVGIYTASSGYVTFSNSKLYDVNLTIDLNSAVSAEGIIEYFTKNFVKPTLSRTNIYGFLGAHINFSLSKKDNTINILITSRKEDANEAGWQMP